MTQTTVTPHSILKYPRTNPTDGYFGKYADTSAKSQNLVHKHTPSKISDPAQARHSSRITSQAHVRRSLQVSPKPRQPTSYALLQPDCDRVLSRSWLKYLSASSVDADYLNSDRRYSNSLSSKFRGSVNVLIFLATDSSMTPSDTSLARKMKNFPLKNESVYVESRMDNHVINQPYYRKITEQNNLHSLSDYSIYKDNSSLFLSQNTSLIPTNTTENFFHVTQVMSNAIGHRSYTALQNYCKTMMASKDFDTTNILHLDLPLDVEQQRFLSNLQRLAQTHRLCLKKQISSFMSAYP